MPDIITVGEILVEVMATGTGQEFTQPGSLLGPFPSGAPAIFIDQAACMGASCGIIARVGDDDFGKLNLDRLRKDGVDISQIKIDNKHTTGTAFVTYYKNGGRKFIFHFAHSAAGFLSSADVKPQYVKSAKFLHIMGCSLSAGGRMRKAVLKALQQADEANVKIAFDPNIRPELLKDRKIMQVFGEVLKNTRVLLTGENEVGFITGGNDLQKSISGLLKQGVEIIVLKNGKKGTRVIEAGGDYRVPPLKVKEVDPTGAGDCFDGAFLAALVQGYPVKQAAEIANAAGALSVTKKGPMEGVHSKEEILEFLKTKMG